MPNLIFHHPDGTRHEVDAPVGTSVMAAAVTNGVPGVVGECGGEAMCATCHVYVRPEYVSRLPPLSADENEMLEETACPRDEHRSRLGCQLPLTAAVLEVDLPDTQI